ncbi:MAG: glycosyltransferase family 2 protein [Woeseia sp.]
MKTCVIVPHFDHLEEFRSLLPKLAALGHHLVVVDDASPTAAFLALERLLDEGGHDATLIRHPENLGKGGAVASGLRAAHEAGFSHAVQIDADGQHDPRDIPELCAAAAASPGSLICGEPAFGKDISTLRYYGRYITLYLIWLETLSRTIRDAMCGLRVYPLRPVMALLARNRLPTRMAFDPEILVRAVWGGVPLEFVTVHVRYPEGARSHFRYLGDNLEIAWMHTRLLVGMIARIPHLLASSDGRHGRRAKP